MRERVFSQVAREEAAQKRQEEKEVAFKAEKKKKKKSDQDMAEARSVLSSFIFLFPPNDSTLL